MEGNDKLENDLMQVLGSKDKAVELAKQMGIEANTPAAPEETK